MNHSNRCSMSRLSAALLGALAVLLLAGCFEKRVVWAPDGERAAVVGQDGLRLCDSSGGLSPLLLPRVRLAAWCGNAEQLVVVQTRELSTWAEIEEALGAKQSTDLAAQAEAVWEKVDAGTPWGVTMLFANEKGHAVEVFLREKYDTRLKERIGDAWADVENATVEIQEVLLARIAAAGSIEVGDSLFASLDDVIDVRPSPRGSHFAITTEAENDTAVLHLAAADKTAASTVVAERTAAYPDWTADGRFLVYARSADSPTGDGIVLGSIIRREVIGADGRPAVAGGLDDLAAVVFNVFTRVRCLGDGRILFNSVEFGLPVSARDVGDRREQLFAIDPERQPTLVRMILREVESELPEMLPFFEVSPDEKQIVVGSIEGHVTIVTLATGEIDVVQQQTKQQMQGAPVWRRAGEVSYLRRNDAEADGKPAARPAEVVLRRGAGETVLSRAWPDDVVKAIVDETDR